MTRRTLLLVPLILSAAMILLLSGCARTRPVHYYRLTALARPAATEASHSAPRLFVEYVIVPKYLDRPSLVTYISEQEIRPMEFHRWAEPLRHGITSVLAQNLAAISPGWQVAFPPGATPINTDCTVHVRILRFDGSASNVHVEAQWSLHMAREEQQSSRPRKFTYTQKPAGRNPEQIIRAFDSAILALSNDISQALKPMENR